MNLTEYLRAVEKGFDAEVGLYSTLSGPGYHLSRIPAGQKIHPTLHNTYMAWYLLRADGAEFVNRGRKILHRLIDEQGADPSSDVFGAWSLNFEEPVEDVARPKSFWPDFHAVVLCELLTACVPQLGPELTQRVRQALRRAGLCTFRHNLGVHYSNFSIMATCTTLVGGELLGDPFLLEFGKAKLARLIQVLEHDGGYAEWNSPTYTIVSLGESERLVRLIRDEQCRANAKRLWRAGWEEIAHYFHPGINVWAGPHSRAYSDHMSIAAATFLRHRTGLEIPLHPSVAPLPGHLDDHPFRGEIMSCPPELVERFKALPMPEMTSQRLLYRSYVKDEGDFYSTTWFAPDATLGSVNLEDLWFQRRSVLGYWKTPEDPAVVLRVRFLHDDYDFSSAYIRNDQDGPRVLSAFGLLSNMGDKMAHIDMPADGVFRAEDFRVRYELTGKGATVRDLGGGRFELACGDRKAVVHTLPGKFGPHAIRWQAGQKGDTVFVDAICYHGPREAFNLVRLGEVAIAAGLEVLRRTDEPSVQPVTLAQNQPEGGKYIAQWPVGRGLKVSGPMNAIQYPGYKGGERARTD